MNNIFIRTKYKKMNVNISKTSMLIKDHSGYIDLSPFVYIGHGCILIATNEKSSFNSSSLSVGECSVINDYCNIRASGGSIKIGKKSMIAQHVSIIATNHTIDTDGYIQDQTWSSDTKKNSVIIGDNVWIGCGSIILPGVTIGDGAVIGAGSVVTKSVGDDEVHCGNPAKYIRMRKLK